MSSVIRECEKRGLDYFILHTGQHYSYGLDRIFFQELDLPDAKYNLDIGSGLHGRQTGKMLEGIEKILITDKPDIVLIEGDTNTVLAGALTASKLQIKVGHVEAGLRSFDRRMPEEINRILTDHISDFLFAPTMKAKKLLCKEGISSERIFITGNTIVDAVYQNLSIAKRKVDILGKLNLQKENYFLLTIHREENVDIKYRLQGILGGIKKVHQKYGFSIIFPIHPRTEKRMKEFGLTIPSGIKLIKPLGFLEFLQLEANARLVLTDSGGVQEEACILQIPCITLRDNTERPETIEIGCNVIAGTDTINIQKVVEEMFCKDIRWINPFGNSRAGEKILDILISRV